MKTTKSFDESKKSSATGMIEGDANLIVK